MAETQSIEQLENDFWKETDFPTGLVERCYRYRKIPIGDLTPAQLRTLIGQQIGLKYLIPLALAILKKNILIEAEFYEGDLLSAIIDTEDSFWEQYPATKFEVQQLILEQKQLIEHRNEANQFRQLLKKIDTF
jgi:hypothetical protein